MVESLISEEEWAYLLEQVPAWEGPRSSVLVVAPHPDDETLGAGGLIATLRSRGIEVLVAAVTDGEHAYPENSPSQIQELGRLRRNEQTQALALLGVDQEKIVRFQLPDSAVASRQDELVDRLALIVNDRTHILAPWRGDFHPDHLACGLAAEKVAQSSGARLSSYFFWTWHQGSVSEVGALPLRSFPLAPAFLQAKQAALLCHRSQLQHEAGEPILPELLLAPARRNYEIFLVPADEC